MYCARSEVLIKTRTYKVPKSRSKSRSKFRRAMPFALPPLVVRRRRVQRRMVGFQPLFDRRLFDPTHTARREWRVFAARPRSKARSFSAFRGPRRFSSMAQLQFDRRTKVCMRRRERRRVLHARGAAGGKVRRRRIDRRDANIHCRRR